MEVKVVRGSIQDIQADTVIVNLFEGATPGGATGAVDKALKGMIADLIAGGDFTGKANEIAVLYPHGAIPARRVIVVGLGKEDAFKLEVVRRASATAVRKARDLNASQVATIVHGAGAGGLQLAAAAQATVEGARLGLYRVPAQKTDEPRQNELQSLTVVEFDAGKLAEIEAGVRVAEAGVQGVVLARDLVNGPPAQVTPTRMAEVAREMAAQCGMQVTIGDRQWAEERRMGGFLAVARGAGEEPRFIVLEYNPGQAEGKPVVIVGKGLTFDSGGISIKPSDKMEDMKSDMAGAAAVLGAMKAVALLKLPLRVIGIAACTENMPDAHAYHPADVITFSNGKTAEVISTDAEGRMVLADALVYARQYQPQAVIDLATLTGACVTALGEVVAAGLFCTDDWLRDRLVSGGTAAHERVWPMPLWDDYKAKIKSLVADMTNTGGRGSGVGSSAIFLKEFIDYPWAHIDMAGMALYSKLQETPYIQMGASGYGVRLLVEVLRNWS